LATGTTKTRALLKIPKGEYTNDCEKCVFAQTNEEITWGCNDCNGIFMLNKQNKDKTTVIGGGTTPL
jgi:Zn finger protein HypA/HybF involved in hydrogenase expression